MQVFSGFINRFALEFKRDNEGIVSDFTLDVVRIFFSIVFWCNAAPSIFSNFISMRRNFLEEFSSSCGRDVVSPESARWAVIVWFSRGLHTGFVFLVVGWVRLPTAS